ncbi:MAG: hypothetical protein ABSD38_31820 [Syntrophorhabdales bacterium]
MKYSVASTPEAPPLARSLVVVYADIAWHDFACGVVRQDDGHVASLGDHRVTPVGRTLTTPMWVHMHVRHDRLPRSSTQLPDLSEVAAVKFDDAVPKTVGVYVVIE